MRLSAQHVMDATCTRIERSARRPLLLFPLVLPDPASCRWFRACHQYGPAAFESWTFLAHLVHNDETVAWLIRKLEDASRASINMASTSWNISPRAVQRQPGLARTTVLGLSLLATRYAIRRTTSRAARMISTQHLAEKHTQGNRRRRCQASRRSHHRICTRVDSSTTNSISRWHRAGTHLPRDLREELLRQPFAGLTVRAGFCRA